MTGGLLGFEEHVLSVPGPARGNQGAKGLPLRPGLIK